MQPPRGPDGESERAKARKDGAEPLPLLVSAALEPGAATLAERVRRIALYAHGERRYTVLGDLAQGGMGKVLRAWDEALSREVAMKVVPRQPRPGSSDEERTDHERRLARFIDEARITAQLDHPGIVPVYEIGLDEAGAVFFTMPLVRGRDLKSIFARVERGEDGWTLQRAVDVMHQVCLTVAFAHSKEVVHRDLKPENVMVGPFGEVFVMDWGLALLLGRSERGSIVGTPAYMSPEQAAGRIEAVGPRSDVYSLGAILYELLSGRVPHQASLERSSTTGASLDEVLAAPPRPLQALRPDVPGDLAAVSAKAMARDPRERYAGALEMADDLASWLAGRVVRAAETGPWTRVKKWRARNRGLALALDALAALVVVGIAAFSLQQRAWLREVQAKHDQALVAAYAAGLSAADLGLRAHEAGEAKRRLGACDPGLRGWEWRHLALRSDPSVRALEGHGEAVRAVAVSPDGAELASGSDDGKIRAWEAASGRTLRVFTGHEGPVTALAYSADGGLIASGSRDDSVRVWDARGGALAGLVRGHGTDVTAVALAGDGETLASGDNDGRVLLTSTASGAVLAEHRPEARDGISGLAFLAAPAGLAAAYQSGTVRLLGVPDLAPRFEAQVGRTAIAGIAAGPDGSTLAVALDRTALLLDAADLRLLQIFPGQGSKVTGLALARDGSALATSGFDNVVRLWDVASARLLCDFEGHDSDVNAVAFFPDGRRLASGSEDHTLRVWDRARTSQVTLHEGAAWVDALALSPDGRELAAGTRDRRVRVFAVASGTETSALDAGGIVDCLAWAGRRLVLGCGDPGPRLAPDGTDAGELLPAGDGSPRTLVADPGGARLFVRDSLGAVRLYDLAGRRVLASARAGEDESASLALSSDGQFLAAGTVAGEVFLWHASTLALLAKWTPVDSPITALAFEPGARRIAVASQDKTIALCSTRTGAVERRLSGHERLVSCLAFDPRGERLFSGSYDHTVRVWGPEDDSALLTLSGHTDAVTAIAFEPVSEVLVSASKDGSVRLWRTARSFEPRAPPATPSAK
jgi:WD40 repeat protein/tRNA A-37 threonylcarbamoyl transferase component Bud32